MLLYTKHYGIHWVLSTVLFLSLSACKIHNSSHQLKEYPLKSEQHNSTMILGAENTTLPQIHLIKPTEGKHISSEFGMRSHPTKKRQLFHTGIDILGKRGDKILAAADGIIIFCGRKGSYGLTIDLDIGHLDKLHVKKGISFCQGECIGKLGRTGRTTAPHLHFEVRVNNIPVDPMQFITPNHYWLIKPQATKNIAKNI